jgi:hypothetical protein
MLHACASLEASSAFAGSTCPRTFANTLLREQLKPEGEIMGWSFAMDKSHDRKACIEELAPRKGWKVQQHQTGVFFRMPAAQLARALQV